MKNVSSPRPGGRRLVLGGLAVAATLVWFLAGWRHAPLDRYLVKDSSWLAVTPRRLSPGWHWCPPPFFTVRTFPAEARMTSFATGLTEPFLRTPDGTSVALMGNLTWRVDESGLSRLATQVRGNIEKDLLAPALRDAVRQLLQSSRLPHADREGEEAVFQELAPRLAAAGLALVSLNLDRVGTVAAIAAAVQSGGGKPIPGARVLLVGWDGADWNILDPLLEKGELPHLAHLIEAGARARLKTVAPVLSPVIWTSIATGVRPEKHGIVDFVAVDPKTGRQVPVTSNLRRVPALWNLVSERGLQVGMIAWWATWPAEQVRGYLVSDRIAYQLFGLGERLPDSPEGKTWPPGLIDEIRPLIERPEEVNDDEVRRFANLPADQKDLSPADLELLSQFKVVLAATDTYEKIALRLANRDHPALRSVYFEASDTAAHLFMPFRSPRRAGVDPDRFAIWRESVDAVYRHLDEILGRLLRTVDEKTTVLVVSDHGFRSGDNRLTGDARIGAGRAAEWHRKYGVLVVSGPGARAGARLTEASVVDIAPTILALLGLPIPQAMDGTILEGALSQDFLEAHPPFHQGGAFLEVDASQPIPSASDRERLRRLESLGYITPATVGSLQQEESTAYNNRGTILLSEGKTQEAIAELRKGLQRAPAAIGLRLNLARALRGAGRDEEALEVLQPALSGATTESWMAENFAGNIYMDRGQLDQAERHFQAALKLEPNSAPVFLSLGLLWEKRGQPGKALEEYRKVSRMDPDSAEAFNNIGNIYRAQALQARGRGKESEAATLFQDAENAYRAGLQADPDFIGTYNNLALVYQDTGRNDEAMDLYRRALDRSPDQAVVHNNLGSLYFQAGRLKLARIEFEKAIQTRPDYESAYNNLGAVLGRLGETEQELAAYQKAVELDPGYADAYHNLGLVYLRGGEDEAAEKNLKRATQLNPEDLSAFAALGSFYLDHGQSMKAVAMFNAALAINPDLYVLRNQLAEAYLAAGKRKEGIAEFQRSLATQPDQPTVRERLDSLGA
ncbi:MAG: tetratricopeptide repeat protein [Acidobacteriota bacterium]